MVNRNRSYGRMLINDFPAIQGLAHEAGMYV